MSVPVSGYVFFVVGLLVLLAVDLVAHRGAHEVRLRSAAAWSAVWVTLGLGFTAVVGVVWGGEYAGQYVTGYTLEKTLAVDNLAVIAMIMTAFAVPATARHRLLFAGVVGALLFRGAFIAAGSVLITRFSWVLYLFGAVLIVAGVRMLRGGHEPDPTRQPVVRLLRRVLPVSEEYSGARFFTRRTGRLVATPLLAALLVVETTDVVFAVDSVPAVFAVTEEPFLVFTSNALAVLGLRSLYFLLDGALARLTYLRPALAVLLVLIGVKLALSGVFHLPAWATLAAIVIIVGSAVLLSLRRRPPEPAAATTDRPLASTTQEGTR